MKHKTKQCLRCLNKFTPTGRNQKYCKSCIPLIKKERSFALYEKTYVRKGYNQSGENNNNWTGGIGIYRRLKKADKCERCGSNR